MLTRFAVTAMLLLSNTAQASTWGPDTYGYRAADSAEVSGVPYAWATGGAWNSIILGDDQLSTAIPLGFSFDYYGTLYSSIYVCSNGFASFDATAGCSFSAQSIPGVGAPKNAIHLWWEDLNPTLGGAIRTQTSGGGGNQVFTLEFDNIQHFGGGNAMSAQMHLYEADNSIEVHYQAALSDGGNHSAGIENAAGNDGLRVHYGTAALPGTPIAIRYTTAQETVCDDGIDNDVDGAIDCLDPDCDGVGPCVEAICDDGLDNEGDGQIDCADADCGWFPGCGEYDCFDGVDNDGDFLIDCLDPDCALDRDGDGLSACESECIGPNAFNYTDMAGAASSLTLNGDAAIVGTRLRITPAINGQNGSAWHDRVPVDPPFETYFAIENWGGSGADGIAFVIQDESATSTGISGLHIGYGGVTRSLAVEFDTFSANPGETAAHVAVHSCGTAANSGDATSACMMSMVNTTIRGGIRTVRIVYDPGTLDVYFDGALITTVSVNLDTYLGLTDGHAWVGFTASTGGFSDNNDVLGWSYGTGCSDCDDADASNFPGNIELCDGADNDCNGLADFPDELIDTDGDGTPDGCDVCSSPFDSDGDTVPDDCDVCPGGDDLVDTDVDGLADFCDICPLDFDPAQGDVDGDGTGDACDNCPNTTVASQTDGDSDGVGDDCD
ncbi:MAG: hypothetical protein GWP91_10870, partial [Rhodobacterales bacterium]|nr:hypothetical protein [Rhodobacterales bacterium]